MTIGYLENAKLGKKIWKKIKKIFFFEIWEKLEIWKHLKIWKQFGNLETIWKFRKNWKKWKKILKLDKYWKFGQN